MLVTWCHPRTSQNQTGVAISFVQDYQTLSPLPQVLFAILPDAAVPAAVKAAVRSFGSDAYIQIALHGLSLRQAVWRSSGLRRRHHARVGSCVGIVNLLSMPGEVTSYEMLGSRESGLQSSHSCMLAEFMEELGI